VHLSENTDILVYFVRLLEANCHYRVSFLNTCQMAVIANGAHVFVACGSEAASGHLKLLQKAHRHSSHYVFSMSIQTLLISC